MIPIPLSISPKAKRETVKITWREISAKKSDRLAYILRESNQSVTRMLIFATRWNIYVDTGDQRSNVERGIGQCATLGTSYRRAAIAGRFRQRSLTKCICRRLPLNNKSCRTSCSWLLCQQNASVSISCRRLNVFELECGLIWRRLPRHSALHRETTFSARIFQSSTANPSAALSQSAAHCSRMVFSSAIRRPTGWPMRDSAKIRFRLPYRRHSTF